MSVVLRRLCGKARRQAVLPERFLLAAIAEFITQTSRKGFAYSGRYLEQKGDDTWL
jgi:hypothetical protein